jgi:predicted nucleic acid-binding protein
MEQGFLLDTNIVIYYLEGVLDSHGKIFLIAATALCFNLNLITRNISDFSSIQRIESD